MINKPVEKESFSDGNKSVNKNEYPVKPEIRYRSADIETVVRNYLRSKPAGDVQGWETAERREMGPVQLP